MPVFLQHIPDQLYTLVGVASSALMIIGRGIYWLLTRKRKKLCYQTTTNESIFHPDCKILDQNTKVIYNNIPVTDPGFLELKIYNAGNVAIEKGEFNGDIKITFENKKANVTNTHILQAKIENRSPFTDPQIESNGYKVSLQPATLNKGEFVKVQFLLDRCRNQKPSESEWNKPIVHCHVTHLPAGISECSPRGWNRQSLYAMCLFCLLAMIFFLLSALSGSPAAYIPCLVWLLLTILFLIMKSGTLP